ncbi:MAG: hypothetical protein H7Y61_20735 [Rhizobiales bacterium]|nr:hypothetical protein [Rhizobacter sp.]
MSPSALSQTPGFALTTSTPRLGSSPAALRTLLLAGCIASVAAAAWVGEPAASVRADPELAFLLRGMAGIKAAIVLAAVGVLFWRFGHAVSKRSAGAYLVGAWLLAGATALVWQLSFVPFAALAFHAGEFTLLFVAWRDHQGRSSGFRWKPVTAARSRPSPRMHTRSARSASAASELVAS